MVFLNIGYWMTNKILRWWTLHFLKRTINFGTIIFHGFFTKSLTHDKFSQTSEPHWYNLKRLPRNRTIFNTKLNCPRVSFKIVPTCWKNFVGNQPSFKIEFININMGQSQCQGFSAKDKCTLFPYFCHSTSGTVNLLWSITKCSNFGLLWNNSESISSKWFFPFFRIQGLSDCWPLLSRSDSVGRNFWIAGPRWCQKPFFEILKPWNITSVSWWRNWGCSKFWWARSICLKIPRNCTYL